MPNNKFHELARSNRLAKSDSNNLIPRLKELSEEELLNVLKEKDDEGNTLIHILESNDRILS